jgi:N-acetylglucosaminyldiphosphoundecaprenol N-acetyl-beta-D-mannosaminyltransferase
VGTYTPPFRDLNAEEEESLIARVRELKPDIIWVGISTPKQERFMHRYLHRLDTTIMFGVGAAYDFHTGRIQDAPQWVKTIGMQWLHRLMQDPRRLWKRYLRNNPAFLWHMALELSGLRHYPPAARVHPPAQIDAVRTLHTNNAVGPLTTPAAQLQRLGS